MNTSNVTNYKPKDFARLLGLFRCRLYGLRKYKNWIRKDEEIVEELQDGNRPDPGAENTDP